jgi:hypothetical protein
MPSLYESYKPLRNYLRKFNLWSGLTRCYQFIQFLDFDRPLPKELQHPRLRTKIDRMRMGIVQWEFEILIREVVLNCDTKSQRKFEDWRDVALAINHIKRIENDAYGFHESQDSDILFELVRIAHRQFPWQAGLGQEYVARYHWLYRQPGLCDAVDDTFGMGITELAQISLGLAGTFKDSPVMDYPFKNEINSIDQGSIDNFVDALSIDLKELKKLYLEYASYDVNWAYSFNPLRSKPIIRLNNNKIFAL